MRIAPLFDHGLSLLYSCLSDHEAINVDIMEDKRCQNFIGGYSCYENLAYVKDKKDLFKNKLQQSDKHILFCWNYGKEDEVHDVGNNWEYILKEGMEFQVDERGCVAQFENGLCPRFTTPDEKGNVILDYCFRVK